jgi:hypothetical protein
MIFTSEQPFNGPVMQRLTGGHCEAIVTYTFYCEIAWPLAQRSRMMDYKDLRGAKALSGCLMPELQEESRVSSVTSEVCGVQVTPTHVRGVLSRVQRSGGIEICVHTARRRPELTGANAGT